jgi:lysophospholipase L1-like esterase
MTLMNNQMIKVAGLTIAMTLISACDTDFKDPVAGSGSASSGSAEFTKFVAIGDSLTAGYADRALYQSGQENSYPAILAQQFSSAGGGSFNQPLVSDNLGGLLFGGNANPDFANRLVLDAETQTPAPIAGSPTTEVIGSGLNGTAFNNMGVPGAKSFHLVAPGYGNAAGLAAGAANPYFVRFASSATTTMIADAASQAPSFYTLWIGNNDILSYATSGGVGANQLGNLDPSTYGSEDITDPNVFAGVYAGLVGAFKAANPAVKGALINLPDVSTIPFFTTIPFNPLPIDQATADALNAAYAPYNGGIAAILGSPDPEQAALRTITFTPGQNAVVILDESLSDLTGINPALLNLRQATADDLLLLSIRPLIGQLVNPTDDPASPASPRWGISAPLIDEHVLTSSEIQDINTARLAFNATIKNTADADANLVFLDVAAKMTELNNGGIDYGTGFVQSTYATGGAFSLDGVHPTARGYSIIANSIIETINTSFGANVPTVDPGTHTTIFLK